MKIIDGRSTSLKIQQELSEEVNKIKKNGGKVPHLAALLVGNDGASQTYVNAKVKACERVGFDSTLIQLETSVSEQDLLDAIQKLNDNNAIDGFIVQLPLPDHIDETKVTLAISPQKDVDGFHPQNVGRMNLGLPTYLPATPNGVIELLKRYEIETSGKNCVVVGRSNIVGSPMSILMSKKDYPGNATVTLVHSRTKDVKSITKEADILIVALGVPEFITEDMVKDGAVVIDVGIHRVDDPTAKRGFRLKGDVKFDEVASKCSFITPVPGGVGPMTIASLLMNTLKAVNNIYE